MVWSLPIELYPHPWSPKFLFTLSQTLEWKFVLLSSSKYKKTYFYSKFKNLLCLQLIDLQKISLHIKCLLKYYFLQNMTFRMIAAGCLPSAAGLCSVTLALCFHQSHVRRSIVRVQLSISEMLGHTSLEVFVFPVSRTQLWEKGKFNKYFFAR